MGTVGTGAPGGTTGAGLQLYGTELWVAGNRFPIGPDVFSAGAGSPTVTPETNGTVACGPLNLVCVPGYAGIYYNGADVLVVSVLGLAPAYVTPLGRGCSQVFNVNSGPPASCSR